jgi:hypothetical protein
MRNEVWKMVARLLGKHAKLTDVSRQSIDAMNNYLKLFPMFRVVFRDIRGRMENLRKKVEMPSTVFVNRAVPVIVIAEWA